MSLWIKAFAKRIKKLERGRGRVSAASPSTSVEVEVQFLKPLLLVPFPCLPDSLKSDEEERESALVCDIFRFVVFAGKLCSDSVPGRLTSLDVPSGRRDESPSLSLFSHALFVPF